MLALANATVVMHRRSVAFVSMCVSACLTVLFVL